MAFAGIDNIVAGMQPPEPFLKVTGTMEAAGILHSLAYTTGRPGAMAAPAAGLNGAVLTSKAGQIPFTNPGGTLQSRLAHLRMMATLNGSLIIADRIWENSGIAVATLTAQAITSGDFPRDKNGASLGDGIMVGIEASVATTNAGAITNTTLNYTNSAGTASRTATMASFPATAVAGTFVPFQLQAGDVGIRSVQGITLGTSYVTGTIHLVAYRELTAVGLLANVTETLDWQQLALPRYFDNTVPFGLWMPSATTTCTLLGATTLSNA